jgi:hypothetical protein
MNMTWLLLCKENMLRSSRNLAKKLVPSKLSAVAVLTNDHHHLNYDRGLHRLPCVRPLQIQFFISYDISTLYIRSFYATIYKVILRYNMWMRKICFTREGVFNVHNIHRQALTTLCYTRKCWSQLLQRMFGLLMPQILRGLQFLSDRLSVKQYGNFMANVLPTLLNYVPLAVRQG